MKNIGKNLAVQELDQRVDLKTRCWFVYNRKRQILGKVRWERPWRRYAFVPTPLAVFSPDCLGDIARFTREQTTAHNKALKDARTLALK